MTISPSTCDERTYKTKLASTACRDGHTPKGTLAGSNDTLCRGTTYALQDEQHKMEYKDHGYAVPEKEVPRLVTPEMHA